MLNIQYVIYLLEKKNFIPVLASNVPANDYYLITPIIAEKFKECNFLHVGENLSLSLRKKFLKVKSKHYAKFKECKVYEECKE